MIRLRTKSLSQPERLDSDSEDKVPGARRRLSQRTFLRGVMAVLGVAGGARLLGSPPPAYATIVPSGADDIETGNLTIQGNLLVPSGTVSVGTSTPNPNVQVHIATGFDDILYLSRPSQRNWGFGIDSVDPTNRGYFFIADYNAPARRLMIFPNGDVSIPLSLTVNGDIRYGGRLTNASGVVAVDQSGTARQAYYAP